MNSERYRKKTKRHNVRFTDEEYKSVKKHAETVGKSVDSLLRETYFKRTVGLQKDLEDISTVLSNIGSDVDQILNGTVNENSLGNVLSGLTDLKKRISCGL
ncbi:MAG: hypothetical protein H8D23_35805 [Candidatus Brocadiales bacterium]|nr:hypothetical protein [Candidatus Brocadiales bacterium]MBL7110177.1 hypothetical protein [Candidatus Neomarinimicrobiota bacterium]